MDQIKLLLVLLVLKSINHRAHSAQDESPQKNHLECGVYLAESTISGAGLGMFAGNRDYKEEDLITDGDLMVPIFEIDWHNGHLHHDFLWDEYTWAATMFWGTKEEIEDQQLISVASHGMGSAPNCFLPLTNAGDAGSVDDYYNDKIGLDNAGLSSLSAGVGSFTPYNGRPMEARKEIPRGQELFVSYGEEYFESRDAYSFVPLSSHYEAADEFIENFQNFISGFPDWSVSVKEGLWEVASDESFWNSRMYNALPDSLEDAVRSTTTGGTAMKHYNTSIRSLDWLEENGECMDNIIHGLSTIPDAGRGAFARRFINKGEVVSPAPLIHLPDRGVLDMFDGEVVVSNEGDEDYMVMRDEMKPNHKQLLLNYCFGHRDSTLLLCPYGYLTALINHSHKEPNTKIVWSRKPGMMMHPEWMNQSIAEWGGRHTAGLKFDFVALRDIEESEEILVDYGEEWEDAWQNHVRNFKSPRPDYIPAFELNRLVDLKVRTLAEYDYRAEGVNVFCRRQHVLNFGIDIEEADDWEGYEDEPHFSLGIYPCRPVSRHNDDSYDVELISAGYAHSDDLNLWPHHEVVSHVLFDVPRDTFYFRDEPMHRDHHQTWSFRHDMRIPDEMFPEAWKNRAKTELKQEETETVTEQSEFEKCQDDPSCFEL